MELKTWDTSGFQNAEVFDSVNKNSFGLTVSVELKQIAYLKSRLDFSSFGFASAYACSCPPDEYINADPFDHYQIRG